MERLKKMMRAQRKLLWRIHKREHRCCLLSEARIHLTPPERTQMRPSAILRRSHEVNSPFLHSESNTVEPPMSSIYGMAICLCGSQLT